MILDINGAFSRAFPFFFPMPRRPKQSAPIIAHDFRLQKLYIQRLKQVLPLTPKSEWERLIGELAALGAAIIWAIEPTFYRKALLKTKPFPANTVRCLGTSAVLICCLLATVRISVLASLPLNAVILTCLSGIIGLVLGDTLYMEGLKLIGVTRAVPLVCTYPLFNFFWAVFLLGEPVTLPLVFGAVMIVFGVWLLSQKNDREEIKTQKKILIKGVIASLGSAVTWSIAVALVNMVVKFQGAGGFENNLAFNTIRTVATAVSLLALSPILDRDHGFLKVQRKTLIELCAGGVMSMGIGWFLLNFSFLNTLESQAVPISSTTPLFSTLIGTIFLKEKVTMKSALGSIAIVIGISLIFMI